MSTPGKCKPRRSASQRRESGATVSSWRTSSTFSCDIARPVSRGEGEGHDVRCASRLGATEHKATPSHKARPITVETFECD